MPIYLKKDSQGHYYQFGDHGKKYYFNTRSRNSRDSAYTKAFLQEKAIFANRYGRPY